MPAIDQRGRKWRMCDQVAARNRQRDPAQHLPAGPVFRIIPEGQQALEINLLRLADAHPHLVKGAEENKDDGECQQPHGQPQ